MLISCSTLEQASLHGFNSGFYTLKDGEKVRKVYVDVADPKINIYYREEKAVPMKPLRSIHLEKSDSLGVTSLKFRKQSLDIDLTTIFFKYRPSVFGLPQQLTSDLNISLYAGWRNDHYKIASSTDPLGRAYSKLSNLGYDFGVFAGTGSAAVSPFSTNYRTINDYTGMIFQTGVAGFLEFKFTSFGVSVGLDNLLNEDRKIWVYNKKPWIGFIAGIALN